MSKERVIAYCKKCNLIEKNSKVIFCKNCKGAFKYGRGAVAYINSKNSFLNKKGFEEEGLYFIPKEKY